MRKLFVAGHEGMVGGAICRKLGSQSDILLLTKTRNQLDLCDYEAVNNFFKIEKPDEIILAAAKVGGIHANESYPAEFIYQNLLIQLNVIHAAHVNSVQKLLFLGSSCIYPKLASQPISEQALLTNSLEPTNEPYAVAKIAGIKMCESYNRQYGRDYRSVMPTNLYGPGDNYHHKNSHVIAGLIRRFHEAKVSRQEKVVVWGTGNPRREFLFVDEMAEASLFIHNMDVAIYRAKTRLSRSHVNIGSGTDITIKELAELIKDVVGFTGTISFDTRKPDGTPRKLLNVDLLNKLGWNSNVSLRSGLVQTYRDFCENYSALRT